MDNQRGSTLSWLLKLWLDGSVLKGSDQRRLLYLRSNHNNL